MTDFRLDHVALAVRSIDPALKLFRDTLGASFIGEGPIDWGDKGSWRWQQLRLPGGGRIELLDPISEESNLTRFLDKRGEGLHHITLKTSDIRAAIERIEGAGFELVDVNLDDPHWKEAYLRPKQTHGALIQIAQAG